MTDTPDLTALRAEALCGYTSCMVAYVEALLRAAETRIEERLDALESLAAEEAGATGDAAESRPLRSFSAATNDESHIPQGELVLWKNPQAKAILLRARREAMNPERVDRGSFVEFCTEDDD